MSAFAAEVNESSSSAPTALELKERGNKLMQEKHFEAAIEAYSSAIAITPSDHVFFSNRSAAYLSNKDAGLALKDANRCIELNPAFPKGYSRRGAALLALLRFDESLDAYSEGLKMAADDAGLRTGVDEARKAKEGLRLLRSKALGTLLHDSIGGKGVCLVPPSGKYNKLVIWLHGLGDTANGWADFMPSLNLDDTKFVLPTAPSRPISLNGGMSMTGWSDIRGLSIDSVEDAKGLDESARRIRKIVMNEIESGFVVPSKVVIGGFSQGGALSLHTALRLNLSQEGGQQGQAVGGCVALSTWLPLRGDYPTALGAAAKASLPILQIHGDADGVVPFAYGKLSNDMLASFLTIKPRFVPVRGLGHSSDEASMEQVKEFLQKILS